MVKGGQCTQEVGSTSDLVPQPSWKNFIESQDREEKLCVDELTENQARFPE